MGWEENLREDISHDRPSKPADAREALELIASLKRQLWDITEWRDEVYEAVTGRKDWNRE